MNDFGFAGVKRVHAVTNHRQGAIRAWHAHGNETKYPAVVKGAVPIQHNGGNKTPEVNCMVCKGDNVSYRVSGLRAFRELVELFSVPYQGLLRSAWEVIKSTLGVCESHQVGLRYNAFVQSSVDQDNWKAIDQVAKDLALSSPDQRWVRLLLEELLTLYSGEK